MVTLEADLLLLLLPQSPVLVYLFVVAAAV